MLSTSYLPISVTTKGAIDYGYDNKIRDVIKRDYVTLIQNATTIIGEMLTAYCGATTDGTHSGVVSECVALLTHKFSHLGVNEIREAYRLASIDKIDVDIRAYRGVATVFAFGQVMTAYDKLRGSYIKILEDKKLEEERLANQENEKKKKDFQLQILEWFVLAKATKGKKLKSVNDIPFYYFDTLVEANAISIDKETKQVYLDRATTLLSESLLTGPISTDKKEREFIRNLKDKSPAEAFMISNKGRQAEIISLAKKLIVYDLIIGVIS